MSYDTGWFKSSRSGSNSDVCVEVRLTGHGVFVRDSKDPDGGRIGVSHETWGRFLSKIGRPGVQ